MTANYSTIASVHNVPQHPRIVVQTNLAAWLRYCLLPVMFFMGVFVLNLHGQVTYVWSGGYGNWTDPTKWAPNGVPDSLDDATITTNVDVTLTENEELNHLTMGAPGVTPTLNGNFDLTIHNNVVLSGFLYNGGNTNILGDLIWNAGHLGNSGTTGDVTVEGLTTIQTGVHYLLGNTLYVNGGAVQSSGMYITFGGLLVVPTGTAYEINTPNGIGIYHYAELPGGIDNAGLFHRTGAGVYPVASPIVFNNTGTIEADAGTSISFVAGSALNNSGILKGTGLYTISGTFTNTGTIAPGASVGQLSIVRGSLTNSTLEIEISGDEGPGTGHDRLNVTGSFVADGTLEVVLLGGYEPEVGTTFEIVSASGTVTGAFDILELPGSESEWTVTYGASSIILEYEGATPVDYVWNGGTGDWTDPTKWTPNGIPGAIDNATINSGTVSLTADQEVHDLNLTGILVGSFNLDIFGDFNFSGGELGDGIATGTVTVAGVLNVTTNGANYVRKKSLVLNGGGILNGHFTIYNGGSVTIPSGKTLSSISPTWGVLVSSGGGTLINNGNFIRNGTGNASVEVAFQSTGSVSLTSGDFTFNGASTFSGGNLDIPAGRAITFGGGTGIVHNLNAMTISNTASMYLSNNGTQLNLNAGSSGLFTNLTIDNGCTISAAINMHLSNDMTLSGDFAGNVDLTVDGNLSVSGGVLRNNGNTTIGGNLPLGNLGALGDGTVSGNVTIGGAFTVTSPVGFIRKKTIVLNGGGALEAQLTIYNGGSVIIPAGQVLTSNTANNNIFTSSGGGSLINNGTFLRLGTGTLNVVLPFTNSGTIKGTTGISFQDVVTNTGKIAPGASVGELGVTIPSLTNTHLEIELSSDAGPGTGHDRINVTGNFVADGTLEVILLGGFEPAVDDQFQIVSTTGTVSGTFDILDLPGGSEDWDVVYNSNNITLTFLGTPCVETTWYADSDEDSLGDPNVSQEACEAPVGYVANADDCDDTNDEIGGATTWYADTDEDGLGDPNVSQEACESPIGYVANADDCDDNDPGPCPCAAGEILYVDASATGTNSGGDWTNAFTSLQDALALACVCEDITQIWVAEGTYYPDEGTGQINNLRTSTFQLCNGKAVYGGFDGTESNLIDRDWEANVTTLHGDIDGDATLANNAYNVVTGSGTDATAFLSGFTITGGNANGGGVYPASNNNGAGMHNNAGSPTIEYCTFTGNLAGEDGGGMMNHTNSSPSISNCTFTSNTAQYGGGMSNYNNCETLVYNTGFIGNTSIGDGYGGAVANYSGVSPVFINCEFRGNKANWGGALFNFTNCHSVIINSTLSGNWAANANAGGAIRNSTTSSSTIVNSIIWDNRNGALTTNTSASILNINGGSSLISYSIIANSGGSSSWNSAVGTDGGNNIDADPQFVSNADPATAPSIAGDLSLTSFSPAINAGDTDAYDSEGDSENDLDLAGNPRVFEYENEGIIDIGAYEFPGESACPDGPVVYVDVNASGAQDGTSWVNAFTSLQDALDVSCQCTGVNQIWVAEGTYYPDEGAAQTNNLRTSTFTLCNDISIYGGFAGGETLLGQRDWVMHETILDGDIDGNAALSNNAYHVVTGSGVNATAVLDGFTIADGNANGSNPHDRGGGMIAISGSPTLTNLLFTTNSALILGGAMHIEGGSPVLTNCIFQSNTSGNSAGGINSAATDMSVTNCQFYGNTSPGNGGAVQNSGGSPTFANCTFAGNQANHGGGVYTWGTTATYKNCQFSGNKANVDGGGLYTYFNSNSNVTNCTFSGNNANGNGGGIYSWLTPNLIVRNCIVWNNSAGAVTTSASASVYQLSASTNLSYSLIANSGGSGSWNAAVGTDGGNNIDVDPVFVLNVNPSTAPTTMGNLRPAGCSDIVNAGSNAAYALVGDADADPDLAGNSRVFVFGGVIDMGAFELQESCMEPIDCVVSAWSEWSACSVACGPGMRCRTRTILLEPNEFGAPCPVLEECEPCNEGPCATCNDGMMNGLELGIDCGGPDCPPCSPPDAVCGIITVYTPQCCPAYNGPGSNDVWLIPSSSLDAGSTSSSPTPTIQVIRYLSNITFNWTTNGACMDLTPNGATDDADKGIIYRSCYPAIPGNFNVNKLYKLRITDNFGSDICTGTVKLVNGSSGLQVPSIHYVIPNSDEYVSTGTGHSVESPWQVPSVAELLVLPNPGNSHLQVQWSATRDATVNIRIVDMAGRMIVSQAYDVLRGDNSVTFDMASQPIGVYAVLILSDDEVISAKWIKG